MKQNVETMRYKVPKVKNRFIQTHLKLIVICAIILATLVMLSFSYVLIRQSYMLEPRTTILLFCEVNDYDEAKAQADKYGELFNVYFVKYVDDFDNGKGGYDFSRFGTYVNSDYFQYKDNLVAIVIPSRSYGNRKISYTDIEQNKNAILDATTVEELILYVRNSL